MALARVIRGRMLRLLLADADLAAAVASQRLFANAPDARITTAHSRAEILRLARDQRPQIVVVDADLYNSEIDDLLKALRALPAMRQSPIVVTTGKWRESFQELLLARGANAVFAKPISPKRLYQFVRSAGPAMALDIRVPVGVDVTFMAGGGEERGRIVNLSKGGLYLETERPRPVGTRLTVALALPAFTNLAHVEGVVTWLNDGRAASGTQVPVGMGVKFVDAPVVVRKTIALYVSMSKEVVRVT
jgi:uncharacterized protein (TIGR02266 family)